jgi:carboxylesterase type B
MSGEGPEVEKVSEFAFQTLDAFMKSGNPLLHFSDQQWPSYGKDRYTLVIDKEFEVVNDFNSSLREAWEKVEPRIPGNL